MLRSIDKLCRVAILLALIVLQTTSFMFKQQRIQSRYISKFSIFSELNGNLDAMLLEKQSCEVQRISKDDVERLSRGQPAKTKGYGSRGVPHRLNESERGELDRAIRKGFVTLDGTGYRRGRKGSPLANIHRQWSDAIARPQLVHCKASGGRKLDNVVVDFSPLRLHGLLRDNPEELAQVMEDCKSQVLMEATANEMGLRLDYVEDNTLELVGELEGTELDFRNIEGFDAERWISEPIWKLPVISLGVFEGERQNAKKMAQQLAILWGIPQDGRRGGGGATSRRDVGAKRGGKSKPRGLSQHRRNARSFE